MFISQIEPNIAVGASEGEIFQVLGGQANTVAIVLENLDVTNTLTWRFQFSADGTSWTDVAANDTLSPTLSTPPQLLLGQPFYRLMASGNLAIAVKADVAGVSFNNKFTLLNLT